MKSLLLLSICLMFTVGTVSPQQGERKRKARSKKEVIVEDNVKILKTDKDDSGIDLENNMKSSLMPMKIKLKPGLMPNVKDKE